MRTAIVLSSTVALLIMLTSAVIFHTRDQIPPTLDDFRNSAAAPFGSMTVNVDITENDSPTVAGEAAVLYSTDGQASWTEELLAEIPGTSGITWEGSFPVEGGDVYYYFMVHDDLAASFSSPVNSGNVYPPSVNLTADPGDEPLGDAVDPQNNALDLDGARFGYSDTHLYCTLSNATGSWPLSGGLFGPWFLYTAALDNPDAGSDEIAFAMVHANFLVTTGLYAVDASDSSYTRIGDIDCVVSGGDLHLRCSLADLYAHPAFGTYNPSGYYYTGAGTGSIDILGGAGVTDMTNAYSFYHRTEVAPVGVNTAPTLTDPGYGFVVPPGSADRAAVQFYVTYTDSDGHLPVERNLILDGTPIEMGSGPDHDYAAGVQFEKEADISDETHVYYFSFSDGMDTVTTDPDTILTGTGVPGHTDRVAINSVWPQPCRGQSTISFALREAQNARLDVYDVRGRHVSTLWSGSTGEHELRWDGRDESGSALAAGVYFVELTSEVGSDRAKLVVVR